MTPREIEIILIEGLLQTPETIVDFYITKAKENSCTPHNFCLALFEAYKRLNEYVNSNEPNTLAESKNGTREPIKKTINLLHFTNDKINRTLNNENITDLLPGLSKLTEWVKYEITKETYQNQTKNKTIVKTGFQSSLTDTQIRILFDQLKGKYIDKNTNPDYFKAALKPESLPDDFKPITWKLGENSLRELLTFISGYINKKNGKSYLSNQIIKELIPTLFINDKGNGIILNKPKEGEYSQYFINIEIIIKSL